MSARDSNCVLLRGQYNAYKTSMENIGLPDSLLSRFDLLFIVLDKVDRALHPRASQGATVCAVLPLRVTLSALSFL